ncbi:MAG: Flp1 family type IVb pilin [Lachnospiraceae bacterium]
MKKGTLCIWKDQRGISTVEMILILVVLIAIVLIFKEQITSLVNDIFDTITSSAGEV